MGSAWYSYVSSMEKAAKQKSPSTTSTTANNPNSIPRKVGRSVSFPAVLRSTSLLQRNASWMTRERSMCDRVKKYAKPLRLRMLFVTGLLGASFFLNPLNNQHLPLGRLTTVAIPECIRGSNSTDCY
mmetsp:Transcript_3638/g.7589  ORF Transcript_3638/g.7589 Transcript_3638/m.7589 type:complete len:127 (+) Transcript_3638:141-521(+)